MIALMLAASSPMLESPAHPCSQPKEGRVVKCGRSPEVSVSESEEQPAAQPDVHDHEWHNGHGETPDSHSLHALQLAHRAVDKFPELKKRYQKYIGPVAVL